MRDVNPTILTIPQYFKQSGYETIGVGKIYDPRCVDNHRDKPSWSIPSIKENELEYPKGYNKPALGFYQNKENLNIINGIKNKALAKNNLKGKTATFAGLSSSGLSDEGGLTSVLAISENSNADDYCTATIIGISLPTTDQRGYTREGTPDAGAYEFGGTLSSETPIVLSNVKVYPNPASEFVYVEGINQIERIEIYSVLGVLEKTIRGKNYLDISELSSGIYLLKIKNNLSSITKRLVVN